MASPNIQKDKYLTKKTFPVQVKKVSIYQQ